MPVRKSDSDGDRAGLYACTFDIQLMPALTALPPAASPGRTMALLLALLLLLLDGAAAAPPTVPGDVKALCELYFATGGANWATNTGFKTCNRDGTAGSDPCGDPGWKLGPSSGVKKCDTTGQSSRVYSL